MSFKSRLTEKSRKRVIYLYLLFVIILLFNVYNFYRAVSVVLEDPTLPTFPSMAFFKYIFFQGPWSRILTIFCIYVMICLYLCSGDVLLRVCLNIFNIKLDNYLPVKIKRRRWCFCNCSYVSLHKILKNIHKTHSDWIPMDPTNVDQTSMACIVIIKNKTNERFQCRSLDYVLVGSSAEGLGKSYTLQLQKGYRDDLNRFLLRFFCICLPCGTSYSSLRTDIDVILECTDKKLWDFKLDTIQGKPGFVYLVARSGYNDNSWGKLCQRNKGKIFLSSAAVRQAISDVLNSTPESDLPASRVFGLLKHPLVIELAEKGPAVKFCFYPLGQFWYWNENQKFVTFEGDFVFGIHYYNEWPNCANGWIHRYRLWPDSDIVQKIVNNGYMLVPKFSNTAFVNERNTEWCLSFSHSETILSEHIPKVARTCFLALKLILKDHLMFHCSDLKTYHLKTILYWELEKRPIFYWNIEKIDTCFENLLQCFITCVTKQHMPSYWVEGLDLFDNCNTDELCQLRCILMKIRDNPGPYIDNIGNMWC